MDLESVTNMTFCSSAYGCDTVDVVDVVDTVDDGVPSNEHHVLGESVAVINIELMEDIKKLVSDLSESCSSSSSILFGELEIKLDKLNYFISELFQGYKKCIEDLKIMECEKNNLQKTLTEICSLADCKLVASDVSVA